MPLVSTQIFYVPDETGDKKERKIKIAFNQQFGGFYIIIDNIWIAYMTDDERREWNISWVNRNRIEDYLMVNTDYDKLIGRFNSFLSTAQEKIQNVKREKIIIIDFNVSTIIETHSKEGSWSREYRDNKDRHYWQKKRPD